MGSLIRTAGVWGRK